MPLKTRLRVSDVYRDSDNESVNEESPPTSHLASKSYRKTDSTVCATVLSKDVFVLVCRCSYNCSANLAKKLLNIAM
ncbi:hypothetical protein TNCT_342661 [Trichonephila clavata]|uniref:Uncharacterized protein n=1 Tax=Trichonephila clavata TaxID=2740835 RepID=A0A8X6HFV3_TRICU|nr:hypothetical protein TNCT_342661 [Trichonephila clavata]